MRPGNAGLDSCGGVRCHLGCKVSVIEIIEGTKSFTEQRLES